MKTYSNTEAHALMIGFLKVFPGLGRTLIRGDDLTILAHDTGFRLVLPLSSGGGMISTRLVR